MGAVGLRGDEAGEVAARVGVRTRRAEGGIEDPLRVVATEPESLDRVVRRGAARAAEAAIGGGGETAVKAGGWGDTLGDTPSPPSPASREREFSAPSPAKRGRVGEGVSINAR